MSPAHFANFIIIKNNIIALLLSVKQTLGVKTLTQAGTGKCFDTSSQFENALQTGFAF